MQLAQIDKTIQRFAMLKSNDRVVVAVSGGADSVFLTYYLKGLEKKYRLYLHLAHLNHLLRKEEAQQDSIFVQNLARRLKLNISCESIAVKDFAKREKLSLEEAARKVRYDFLLRTAKDNFCAKIALGHNQDDQAETVLMRFLRGSGIAGLRGIPAVRTINGCLIIRPLIAVWRKEIVRLLRAKDISYRMDSSNLANLFFRNKIRNQLLPELIKDFNPNLKELLINFAQNLSDDFDFLQRSSQDRFKHVCTASANSQIALNCKKFNGLHRALQKLIFRQAIKELKGNLRRIDYRHWQELDELVSLRPKNSIVDLPDGISVAKNAEKLIFYKR